MSVVLKWSLAAVLAASFTLLPGPTNALAQCDCIEGSITAEPNPDDPMLGFWKYTIEFCWETSHGLSHWDLWLDDLTNCSCAELTTAVVFGDEIGTTTSDDCVSEYFEEWKCDGDPSTDVSGILVKFEPMGGCEPGQSGTGLFYFYSMYPPVPVSPENPPYGFLINKNGNGYCNGGLSGVFPEVPCDPVPAVEQSWGAVKSIW